MPPAGAEHINDEYNCHNRNNGYNGYNGYNRSTYWVYTP